MEQRWQSIARWLARLSGLALFAAACAVAANALGVRVPSPVALNYVEGFDHLDVLRVAAGAPLYGDTAEPPWTVHVYTPLFTMLLAGLAKLGADGYTAGRLLSYTALLATAGLMIYSGSRRSHQTGELGELGEPGKIGESNRVDPTAWTAAGVAALYLTLPLFSTWGAVLRPDNLALFFAAAGVVVVDRHRKTHAVFWAIPLFLAAIACKQSLGMGLVAAVLFLARFDLRRALVFSALAAVAAAIIAGLLMWSSQGWFYFHTVTANQNPYAFAKAKLLLSVFASDHALLLLSGGALVVVTALRRKWSVYWIWCAASAVSTAAIGKTGSDTNYFLEPMAALGFLAANEWRSSLALARPAWLRRSWALVPVLAAALALSHVPLHWRQAAWIEGSGERFDKMIARLPPLRGPILSDDATLLQQLDEPLLFRPFVMTQLAYARLWRGAPLSEMLERGEIALVVFEAKPYGTPQAARYTARMRRAIADQYRRFGGYRTHSSFEIYAPVQSVR